MFRHLALFTTALPNQYNHCEAILAFWGRPSPLPENE